MKFIRHLIYVNFCGLTFGCNTNYEKVQINAASGYDINNPVKINLPASLDEISGIVYYPKDSSLFAIVDEDGILFKIYLGRKNVIKQWRFDKKRDFEDVALLDSTFFVLVSNGDIESIKFTVSDSLITSISRFPGADKKINEFESLYYDDSLKQLVLYCKRCEGDNKKNVTAWGYNISSGVYTPSVYTIDVKAIDKKLGVEKLKFKPSATAINPLTNELYILASVDHLLVVTDRKGVFRELYELDPLVYKQPEGIAFTPGGDMIITNESHKTGNADILIIKYKKKG